MKRLYPASFRHILMLVVVCIALLLWIQEQSMDQPRAEDGVLDLTRWDYNADGKTTLSGEWEFNWGEFLTYEDYQNGPRPDSIYVSVPQVWNRYRLDGQNLPGFGYATYHLKVRIPDANIITGLRISSMSTAYQCYINDRMIAQNGKISTSPEGADPEYAPETVYFRPPAEEFDVIVHVSNFTYARGGLWFDIDFGAANQMRRYESHLKYRDGIVLGMLAIMAIYFFCYFYMFREDRKNFSFMLMCLILIVRTSLYGDYFIIQLFPDISFRLLVWLSYLTLFWFPVILYQMIEFYVNDTRSWSPNRPFYIYAAVISLITAFTPVAVYTQWTFVIDAIAVFISSAALIKALLAYLRKVPGADIILPGSFIIGITGLHDMLYQANVIRSQVGEVTPIGLIIFMLLLFLQMADKFSRTYREVQSLSEELAGKLKLEQELTESLKKTVNKLVTSEMSFLQAQIKPHFIHNALSVISSLSIRDPYKAKSLILDLSDYLRGSFDLNSHDGLTTLSRELELVHAYLSIEQARFKERLQVSYHLQEDVDCTLPLLTIQPLVENAIRHGIMCRAEGGEIHIATCREPDRIRIEVRDNGVGIGTEQIEKFYESKHEQKGVGMANIHRRLIAHYGEGLHIESLPGQGTVIYFYIPYPSDKEVIE